MSQVTNKEAYELFLSYTSDFPLNTAKSTKISHATSCYMDQHGVPEAETKKYVLKFTRLVSTKPGNKSSSTQQDEWDSRVFSHGGDNSESKVETKKGRPRSSLGDEPTKKTACAILRKQVLDLESFATEQNISKEVALKMLVDECNRLWKRKEPAAKSSMPVSDATALLYNINLSVHQYQLLRTLSLPHNIIFPVRNSIDLAKKNYHPPILSHELKSSVDIKELLKETGKALLQISNISFSNNQYTMVGKFGIDGSGSHKIRHQLVDADQVLAETPHLNPLKSSSFLLACYCPLEILDDSDVVWSNPIPNSTAYTRPVSLTRAPENRDILTAKFNDTFKIIREDYEDMVAVGESVVSLKCKTECSMVDGKMVSLLVGDSGAYCHLCTCNRSDANDLQHITDGFKINKSYESCKEAWEKLQSGTISYSSAEREGMCHENIIKSDLHCCSVLHFKLRSLDFMQKILYHLVAGYKNWSESGHFASRVLESSKKICVDHLRNTTGMLLDQPTSSGGNTNTGGLATKFFNPEYRGNILELILNTEDRENFGELLSLFNIMLTVTQSVTDRKVNVDNVRLLGIEIMTHIKSSFLDEYGNPWINIIPTVHTMCAHSWELFKWNDGKSIGAWSENPLECWNKHVRSFKSGCSARSRQKSIKENIHDIFKRMLIMSHPEIASKVPRPSCSICGDVGHTARSSMHTNAYVASSEESRIRELYF